MNDTWHQWLGEICESAGGEAAGPPGGGLWSFWRGTGPGQLLVFTALGPALPGVALLPAPGLLPNCPSRPLRWVVATGQVKHVDMAVTR